MNCVSNLFGITTIFPVIIPTFRRIMTIESNYGALSPREPQLNINAEIILLANNVLKILGIGKTMFSAYIICHYVQEYPSSNIMWESSSGAVTLHADGNVSLGLDILYKDCEALYLVETMVPTLEVSRPFILL